MGHRAPHPSALLLLVRLPMANSGRVRMRGDKGKGPDVPGKQDLLTLKKHLPEREAENRQELFMSVLWQLRQPQSGNAG